MLAACEAPTAGDDAEDDVKLDLDRPLKTMAGPPSGATHSACEPVQPKAYYSQSFATPNPFIGNSRLVLVEKATKQFPTPNVPCINVDTLQTGTCSFYTDAARTHTPYNPARRWGNTGSWLMGSDGRTYAQAGQRVNPLGTVEGDWVIAARVSDKGTVPCVQPKGKDSAGTSPTSELAGSCILETMLGASNRSQDVLFNYATREVCTKSYPHPDRIEPRYKAADGSYCYGATGAALNDLNGTERDSNGLYMVDPKYCHVSWNGPLEVIAAKRPATKTVPYPGKVNPQTELVWRPVDDRVVIAN